MCYFKNMLWFRLICEVQKTTSPFEIRHIFWASQNRLCHWKKSDEMNLFESDYTNISWQFRKELFEQLSLSVGLCTKNIPMTAMNEQSRWMNFICIVFINCDLQWIELSFMNEIWIGINSECIVRKSTYFWYATIANW